MRRPPRRHDGGNDMTRQHGTAPSQRQLRVGEEIRHMLAQLLTRGDLHDPDLFDVTITVTEVRMSPDLRHATAFVTPLGGAEMERTVAALRRAAPFLQRQVGRELRLRFTPALAFEADRTFEEATKIDRLLREIDHGEGGDGG
jgi:ribosome-binding factor A